MRRRAPIACAAALGALGGLGVPAAVVAGEELLTPVRIGPSEAPVRLSLWAQPDYSHLAARRPIAEAFDAIFREWARERPDVRIDVSVMPALEMHKAKLLLAAAAGRLPDVASIDSYWMPLFLAGGHVQPLDAHWPAADRADFIPFTIETLSDARGRVYGMWHGTDLRVLYYRRDLVPIPPRTWAELLETARRVARERGISGYLFNAGRWEAAVFDHLPMFWGQGGELVDASGRPIFGEPPHRERMVRLLAFLHEAVRSGAAPRAVLASNDYRQLSSAAIAGDVAMFLGGNWQVTELRQGLAPDAFALWDVAPIPQAAAGERPAPTGSGGWVWVVFAKDPVKRRAATEFIRYVESTRNVGRIAQATGHMPVRRSVYRDFAFFREDPFLRKFGAIIQAARARPAAAIYPQLSEELQVAIGAAIDGRKTPEQAVDDAFRSVAARYAELSRPAPARAGLDPVALVPWLVALALVALVWRALGPGRRALAPWLLPALALVALFFAYPIAELLRLAFTDLRTHGAPYRYTLAGLRGVALDPEFHAMLGVTLAFVSACVALQLGVGLALALVLDGARRRGMRGTLAVRTTVVAAWVVPGVLVGVLWRILLVENRSGIANYLLSVLGLGPLPFLSAPGVALGSVIAANVWWGSAFSMILQYAGLLRIPPELHEAADLEGLAGWRRLRLVTLPQIAPFLGLNLALITIATLNTFDLILPLTGGGPARATEVVALAMYRAAFFNLEAGRAAAIASVMLAVNLALALAALRVWRRTRGEAER